MIYSNIFEFFIFHDDKKKSKEFKQKNVFDELFDKFTNNDRMYSFFNTNNETNIIRVILITFYTFANRHDFAKQNR